MNYCERRYNSSERTEPHKLIAPYYNAVTPTVVDFINEQVKVSVNSLGHIEFYDMEDRSYGFLDFPVSKDPSEKGHQAQYGNVCCLTDGKTVRVRLPIYDWYDYYPNCDGESDRWKRIIVRWFEVVLDLQTKQVEVVGR